MKIQDRIVRFLSGQLFKTSLLNAASNAINILTSIVSSKITAIYLGPAGVALLGQFSNFTSMAMSIATMGINSGLVKYVAEYHDQPKKRTQILSSGLLMVLAGTLVVAVVVYFLRHYFAVKILHSTEYIPIFTVLSVTLILFALNAYLSAILNGYKEFKKVASVNILTSIVGLMISIGLVVRYGVYGAFLGIILSQSLVFFITLTFVIRSGWFTLKSFLTGFDLESVKKLLKFSLMTITSLFAVTLIQLQIRNFIIQHISIEDAGYWQGMTRISDIYLGFITNTLAIYYLPKLSELKNPTDLRREILKGYKFILPLTILSSLVIFILKPFIVRILLTDSFLPMIQLFQFQLIGNVLKIASWLLGYLIVAKAMTKVFIVTELLFGVSLYLFTRFFVLQYGVVGATYGYALNYLLYLGVMFCVFRKIFQK